MKKYLSKVLAVFLVTLIIFSMTCAAFASSLVSYHDYSSIKSLPSDYGYGMLEWYENTNVEVIDCKYVNQIGESYAFASTGKEPIKVRINNCAYDKDGYICDVVFIVDNMKIFEAPKMNSDYGLFQQYFPEISDSSTILRNIIVLSSGIVPSYDGGVTVGAKVGTNLIRFLMDTNYLSSEFELVYYKSGTSDLANIPSNASTIYDLDASNITGTNSNEVFCGSEGFTPLYKSDIYYSKNTYLEEADGGLSAPYNKAYQAPGATAVGSQGLIRQTSAFITQHEKAKWGISYAGFSCGIQWVFASPYKFEETAPIKSVKGTSYGSVFENEEYEYTISQYVPNNAFCDLFGIIDSSKYTAFTISDELNENLIYDINSIHIESDNKDITNKFNITSNNHCININPTDEFINSYSFYGNWYTITIPVKAANNSKLKSITNTAKTTVTTSDGTSSLTSNTVTTNLKYHIRLNTYSTNASVSQGSERIVNAGDDNTFEISFNADNGYYISTVTVDGKNIDLDSISENNGTYSYSISDKNILTDIEHNVIVNAELKNALVIVNYTDENGKELADSESIKGKYFDPYDTSEKDIYGYELISIPKNNKGTMEQELTIVNYIYRLKNTSVKVIYADEDENELTDSINIDGKVFDEYSTEVKEFNGYELIEVPDNADGVMTEDTIVVKYIYKLVPSPVIDNEEPELPIEPTEPEPPEVSEDPEIPEATTKTPESPDKPEKSKTVVYQARSPKTGDRASIILCFIGMALALVGLVLLPGKIKKQIRNRN